MTRLWLDDERDPRDLRIQEEFNAEPGMIWVKTADAAIARLKSGGVVFISLDHDLGTTATGHDVAVWIAERAASGELTALNWAVHSANRAGATAIRRTMEIAERCWSGS